MYQLWIIDACLQKKKCRDQEWNTAYNFSSDPTFLTNCMKKTDGTFQFPFILFSVDWFFGFVASFPVGLNSNFFWSSREHPQEPV